MFSIDGREERIREVCEDILSKASLASIEDDLIRFSRLQTKAISLNTLRTRYLFGGTYLRENGIIEEPLSMWKLAASFFELAFRLKAVIDEDSWNGSVYWDGKEVIFGSLIFLDKEQVREVAKKQRLTSERNGRAIFSASRWCCAPNINPDYARFTMTEEEIQKRVYCSGRWDEPGAEMKYWHPFVKAIPNLMQMDILKGKMAMIEARAGFDVAIMLNPRRHAEMIGQGRLPSLVCPLEEFNASFRKEMGAKLC